jgi:hypothetical protein
MWLLVSGHQPSECNQRMSPFRGRRFTRALFTALALFVAMPSIRAEEKTGDLDSYKWRVTGMWWFSHPTGSVRGSADQVEVDIDKGSSDHIGLRLVQQGPVAGMEASW